MPMFVPPLVSVFSSIVVTFLLERLGSHLLWSELLAVVYVSATVGTTIGADFMNLTRISSLNVPMVSIGGGGTFDGIFLAGILSVLFLL